MIKPFIAFGPIFLAILYHSSCVEAQCLTSNDARVTTPDNDLSGIQKFNIDLFQQVYPSNPQENLIFSPYSVWNSLVLAYFGSGGRTEEQFRQVLNVTDKLETLRKWRQLEASYHTPIDTPEINTFALSSRAYFDTSVKLRSCLQAILQTEVRQLGFMKDSSAAADAINTFVAETTRGHITDVVSPADVQAALMVLVNAAFFRGTWLVRFDPQLTTVQPFETLTGGSVDVQMMSQFAKFRYGYDDATQIEVLGVPYAEEKFVMYLFLPYESGQKSFDDMIRALSSQSVEGMLSKVNTTTKHVFLPRFTLESRVEDGLIKALSNMGLREPFAENVANFSAFNSDLELSIDKGIHKAFIDVNEEGTEAGATTAFIANKQLVSMFVCNRPFAFMIRDDQTNNILFIGVLKSPPAASKPSSTDPAALNAPKPSDPSKTPQTITFPPSSGVSDSSSNSSTPTDLHAFGVLPSPGQRITPSYSSRREDSFTPSHQRWQISDDEDNSWEKDDD